MRALTKDAVIPSVTRAINLRLIDTGKTKSDLAAGCGWANSNVSYKMTHNKYSLADLVKIAGVLECDLVVDFVPKNGNKEAVVSRGLEPLEQ